MPRRALRDLRSAGATSDHARRLLDFARALIPKHLPEDVRRDAAASIACDLYARETARRALTPRVVRRYVRAAFGFQDAKRFKSLDAPTRGSTAFGVLMVG